MSWRFVVRSTIEKRIATVDYAEIAGTVVCLITLDNGYQSRAEATSLLPNGTPSRDAGERLAYDKAFNRLYPLFAFLQAEQNFVRKKD
jgi:hypothetical protein